MLSGLMILPGGTSPIHMIKAEDESGALTLLLIVLGTGWFFINQHQIKKNLQKEQNYIF